MYYGYIPKEKNHLSLNTALSKDVHSHTSYSNNRNTNNNNDKYPPSLFTRLMGEMIMETFLKYCEFLENYIYSWL